MRYQQIENTVSVVSVNGMARVIEPDGSTHLLQEGEILKPGTLVVSEESSRLMFDPVASDGMGQPTDMLAQATDQSLNSQSIQTGNALLNYQFIAAPMQALNVSGQVRVIAPDGSTHLVSEGEILQPGMLLVTDANSHLGMEPSLEPMAPQATQLAAQPGDMTAAEIAALQQAILSGQDGALQATAAGKTPDEIAALQQAILQGQDPTLVLEATAAGGAPAAGGAGVAGASGNGGFVVVDRTGDATIAEAGFDTSYQSTPLTGVEDPSALLASENTIPTLSVTPGELDEAVLDTTVDADTDLSDGSLAGQLPSQITGNITVDYLTDVPGSVFFSDLAQQPANLTSGGEAIVWSLSDDGLTLTGSAADQVILTITLSADGSSYVADLDGPLDHAAGEASLSLGLILTAQDSNGDQVTAPLVLTILDDAPLANADNDVVSEDGPITTSGNLLSNDTQGADSAQVTAIQGGNLGQAIMGDFGTLTVNADGSYSFVLDNAATQVQSLIPGQSLSQDFSYTLTDGDGDTSTATLTITVNGADDGVIINGLSGEGAEVVVSDANLADGSAPNVAALTQTGSFDISAPDGVKSLSVAGVVLIANGEAVGLPQTIPSPLGNSLTVTAIDFDADTGTGTISYAYTLLDNEFHTQPFNDAVLGESFSVVLVDDNDSSTSASLDVQVLDDVPTAQNDSASVTEDGPITTGGNLLSNDTQGADSAQVTAISGGDVGQALEGNFGTLTVNADGSYSFVLDNASPQVQSLIPGQSLSQDFSYTLTDGDGDTSTATLTITVNGADDGVIINGLSGEGAEVVVSDANLADGSAPNVAALTQTGSFDISAPDGVKSLSVAGVVLIANGEAVGLPQTIPSPLGNSLTVTAIDFDADTGTGTISYAYTLLDNEFHTQPFNDAVLGESFSVVLVDDNDSTTSASLDVQVLDDIPEFDSVMDAVLSSAATIDFDGRYVAGFGADGLDFITTVLGTTGSYGGETVSFVPNSTDLDGVTRVDVTDVNGEVVFSFYYTSEVNKVSEGGDGSTAIHAFNDIEDPDDSQLFNLTVNADGTYNFDMVSNTVISTSTASEKAFSACGPELTLATKDLSLIIYGGIGEDTLKKVNPSNHGIGVDQPGIENGEWIRMDFARSQTYVRFSLQQFAGSGTALLMLSLDGVAFDFNTDTTVVDGLTIDKPDGGHMFIEVEVDAEHANTWSYDADTYTYTLYVADSFDALRLDNDDGSTKFNVNNITYDKVVTVEDLALNFDMAITDMDGDTSRLGDQLTVVMLDPSEIVTADLDGVDEEAGVVLVGNGEDDTLIGGTGDDILIGGRGNDSLTGGDGADIFKWLAEDTDGSTDTVKDFHLGEDKLDLRDVLDTNANSGNLDQYLDVSTDGVDTVIHVYGHGIPDPTPDPMPAPDLIVVLEGGASEIDQLSDLVNQNSIIV